MIDWAQIFTGLLFYAYGLTVVCWDTPTVKASLWQLLIVSTAFKEVLKALDTFCYCQNKYSYLVYA